MQKIAGLLSRKVHLLVNTFALVKIENFFYCKTVDEFILLDDPKKLRFLHSEQFLLLGFVVFFVETGFGMGVDDQFLQLDVGDGV